MGFIESLVISFAVGWINSYLYRKYLRKRNKDYIIFTAIIFLSLIWIVDIFIYFNIFDIKWLNFLPWVNIPTLDSGKYYLWNSFIVFGVDLGIVPQPGINFIATFIFISYLFWYYFGSKIGKVFHGYRTYQGGFYLLFRPVKKYITDREKRKKER